MCQSIFLYYLPMCPWSFICAFCYNWSRRILIISPNNEIFENFYCILFESVFIFNALVQWEQFSLKWLTVHYNET